MASAKRSVLKWLGISVILVLASAIVLSGGDVLAAKGQSTGVKEYNIKAYEYAYEPNLIAVNKGDRVILHVESMDVAHGLALDVYGQKVTVHPGKQGTVEFVADKVGKYRFRCAETCGALHPFMIGELVVTPNTPFTGSLGLAVVTAAGALGYAWRRQKGGR